MTEIELLLYISTSYKVYSKLRNIEEKKTFWVKVTALSSFLILIGMVFSFVIALMVMIFLSKNVAYSKDFMACQSVLVENAMDSDYTCLSCVFLVW